MYWGRNVEKLGAAPDRKESDSGDCKLARGRIRHSDRTQEEEKTHKDKIYECRCQVDIGECILCRHLSLKFWVKIGGVCFAVRTFPLELETRVKMQPLDALWTFFSEFLRIFLPVFSDFLWDFPHQNCNDNETIKCCLHHVTSTGSQWLDMARDNIRMGSDWDI